QPLEPGEIYEVDLEIWPMGLALPKASRLTLTIQGKDFERPGATGPLRGVAWFTHDNPTDRPPELFAGTNTLHFPLSASGGIGQPRGAAPATLRQARLRWARPSAFARPNRTSVRPLAKSRPQHRRALRPNQSDRAFGCGRSSAIMSGPTTLS